MEQILVLEDDCAAWLRFLGSGSGFAGRLRQVCRENELVTIVFLVEVREVDKEWSLCLSLEKETVLCWVGFIARANVLKNRLSSAS